MREEAALFALSLGGRTLHDKRLTHRALKNAGLRVPRQYSPGKGPEENRALLEVLVRVLLHCGGARICVCTCVYPDCRQW